MFISLKCYCKFVTKPNTDILEFSMISPKRNGCFDILFILASKITKGNKNIVEDL